MPYSISNAKRAALFRNREIYKKIVNIETLYNRGVVDSSIHQMLFQSAMIMACASLEQYLVSFFDDWTIKLQQQNAKFRDIPASLRTYFLMKQQHRHMKELVAFGDEMKYTTETAITKSYYAVHINSRLIKGVIEFRDFKFYTKDSFPTEDNLKKLFSIIGYPAVMHRLNILSRTTFKFRLQSFLDTRNAIAHRQSADLTFQDMQNNFAIARAFIHYLDQILYAHLTATADSKFWPS